MLFVWHGCFLLITSHFEQIWMHVFSITVWLEQAQTHTLK